jgi:hypothetical protein
MLLYNAARNKLIAMAALKKLVAEQIRVEGGV